MDTENSSTQLTFCTTGVILQKVIQAKTLDGYTHIILDEIHEREIDLDLLVIIVRELLRHISGATKIILMSATLDVKAFQDYFTLNEHIPATVKIETEPTFKISTKYLEDLYHLDVTEDFVDYSRPGIKPELYEAAKLIIMDRLELSDKSILVFLPGIYEIESLHRVLSELKDQCLICVLHSSLSTTAQTLAFRPASKPKVILSTNIAESSITITKPEIDCVIDFCLTKYLVAKEKSAMASLTITWASKNSLKQRAGRTGRTCDGTVFRLISQRMYRELLPKSTIPEMERIPLETTVLRVKMLDVLPPLTLLSKAMDPPSKEIIRRSIRILKETGGLARLDDNDQYDIDNGTLTYVGTIMAKLPLDVRATKLIVMGYMFSVLEETIIIAAGLNIRGIFQNRYEKNLNDYVRKLTYADGSACDFIAILNAYKLWKHSSEQGDFRGLEEEQAWCDHYQLERKSLHEMRQLIKEIKERLIDLKMEAPNGLGWEQGQKTLILKICCAGAFIPNFYMCSVSDEYIEKSIHKEIGWKNPHNTVYFKSQNRDQDLIGEVYESQVREQLVAHGLTDNVDKMKVTVDRLGTKTFVEFLDDEVDSSMDTETLDLSPSVSGGTVLEVYKALKLTQMGLKLVLKTMDTQATLEYATNLGFIDDRYRFKRTFVKYPHLLALPTTCTNTVRGIVTNIKHCSKFFIQPTTEIVQHELTKIEESFAEEDLIEFNSVAELKKGQHIIVIHDERLKRAKVLQLNTKHQKVRCFTYDFGETITVALKVVRKVSESVKKHFEIPLLCFEASLSEIRPSAIKCPRGKWTTEAVEEFRNLVDGVELQMTVYSTHNDVASVALLAGEIWVNKHLMKLGFAKECEESLPRKDNHFDRVRDQSCENRFFGPEIEYRAKVDEISTVSIPHPEMSKCRKFLRFTGPMSPMSTRVTSTREKEYQSQYEIYPTSVNSVLLLDDPSNFYGRLLVTSNATSNNRAKSIYDNSLMPDIPGLPVLLALIFAPDSILLRNAELTRYNCIKFGLGATEKGRIPFFPDHDCVMPVNIKLDADDFYDVNCLRFLMSYLLMTQPKKSTSELTDETKLDSLMSVKELIMKILSKKRNVLDQPCPATDPGGNWITEDQSDAFWNEEPFYGGGHYHQLPYPPLKPFNQDKAAKLAVDLAELERDAI